MVVTDVLAFLRGIKRPGGIPELGLAGAPELQPLQLWGRVKFNNDEGVQHDNP
jgi:hypothetical protein